MQVTASTQYPAVDGNLISNVNAVKLQARDVLNATPTNSQYLGWNTVASRWEPMSSNAGSVTSVVAGTGIVPNTVTANGTLSIDVGTAANKILQVTASTQYPAVDGNLISNVNAVKLQARDVLNATPTNSQYLGWNTAATRWEPMSVNSGSVTSVVAGAGIVPNTVTANGTLAVDVGTAANKILQVTPSTQYPAVDGNLISNVNAVKLQARDILNATPTNSQYLGWNTVASRWEPMSGASGDFNLMAQSQ